MKTIEEKAKECAEVAFYKSLKAPWVEAKQMFANTYIVGAADALAGLWRKFPDVDLPDTGSEYIVRLDNGDISAINKSARKEIVKQHTNIVAWMPVPELPKTDDNESHK